MRFARGENRWATCLLSWLIRRRMLHFRKFWDTKKGQPRVPEYNSSTSSSFDFGIRLAAVNYVCQVDQFLINIFSNSSIPRIPRQFRILFVKFTSLYFYIYHFWPALIKEFTPPSPRKSWKKLGLDIDNGGKKKENLTDRWRHTFVAQSIVEKFDFDTASFLSNAVNAKLI